MCKAKSRLIITFTQVQRVWTNDNDDDYFGFLLSIQPLTFLCFREEKNLTIYIYLFIYKKKMSKKSSVFLFCLKKKVSKN